MKRKIMEAVDGEVFNYVALSEVTDHEPWEEILFGVRNGVLESAPTDIYLEDWLSEVYGRP